MVSCLCTGVVLLNVVATGARIYFASAIHCGRIFSCKFALAARILQRVLHAGAASDFWQLDV